MDWRAQGNKPVSCDSLFESNDCGELWSAQAHLDKAVSKEPYLEIVTQPQCNFRFRYKSEMTGKHGSLLGKSPSSTDLGLEEESQAQIDSKTYPTVKLHNFDGNAVLRCSLVCDTPPHYPHAHLLATSSNGNISPSSIQPPLGSPLHSRIKEIMSIANNYTVALNGLSIIYTGRKSSRREIVNRNTELEDWDERKLRTEHEVNDLAFSINLNKVALHFEALATQNGELRPLCQPVISEPIHHNKSIQTCELRIVRIDKYASFCTGDEEVFILVEKVDKHNIQIKFFQENDKGIEIWKAYGKFSKLDVHHQYAIVFKTPPYRSCDIDTDVDVWIQLERPSDGSTSQQIPFKYKPIERLRKMPRQETVRTERGSNDNRDPRSPHYREQLPEEIGANNQNVENDHGAGMPGPSACSARQGANIKFPCDLVNLKAAKDPKELALSVALSVGESLHSWAETSDFQIVLQKLRHLLCLVNENGDNALHTAILNDQPEPFAQILSTLSKSKDVSSIINDTNTSGLTPLAMAVLLNAEFYVKELISFKADISIPNFDGDTPIHLAIKSRHSNCLHHLLSSKMSYQVIDKFNYNSLSPLHLAVVSGYYEAVEMLCRAQVNVLCQEGTYGRTPLHIAVEQGSLETALILLKSAGEKNLVNAQNYRGDTALHCAVTAECPSVTLSTLLLYFGADPLIENFVMKESANGEIEGGHTVFDLVTNDEIRSIVSSAADKDKLLTYLPSNIIETVATVVDTTSLENLNIDSGIDIKESS